MSKTDERLNLWIHSFDQINEWDLIGQNLIIQCHSTFFW